MQHADTVYLNGLLYTGDAQRRFAQALATQGGKIIAVGRDDDIRPLAGPATRIVGRQADAAGPHRRPRASARRSPDPR